MASPALVYPRVPAVGAIHRATPSLLTFLVAFLLLLAVAVLIRRDIPYTGDEPHYLLISHSVFADRDVDLRNNYLERDYARFYVGDLLPQVASLRSDPVWLPWHLPGLSLLVLPGYALDPTRGPALIALVSFAWLAVELRLMLRELGASPRAATMATALVLLAPPLVLYAGRIMPEVPAAVLVVAAFRRIWLGRGLAVAALAVAALPWLGPKFLVLSLTLVAVAALARPRWILPLGLATIVSGAGIAGYLWSVYGSPSPNVLYRGTGLQIGMLPVGALGQLLDAESGLLLRGPLFVVLILLLLPLARQRRQLALAVALVVAAAWTTGSVHGAWWGGFFFAPRYLVPVLPLLAVPLGLMRRDRGWAGATALAAAASVVVLGLALIQPVSALSFGLGDSAPLQVLRRATGIPLSEVWPSFPRPAVEWHDVDLRSSSVRATAGRLTADGARFANAGEAGTVAALPPKLLAGGRWAVSATWRAPSGSQPGRLVVDAIGLGRLVAVPLAGAGESTFNEIELMLGAPTLVVIAVESDGSAPLAVQLLSWRALSE